MDLYYIFWIVFVAQQLFTCDAGPVKRPVKFVIAPETMSWQDYKVGLV